MNENKIIIYENGELKLDVQLSEKTVWLNLNQLVEMFESSKSNVSEHLKRIFMEEDVDENSTVRFFRTLAENNKYYNIKYYCLDIIILLAMRINSKVARNFRKWATNILKEYSIEGYSINRSTCLECQEKINNLQNQIYEIKDFQNKSLTLKETDHIDAMYMLMEIMRSAKHLLVIVDNYFDHSFDEILLHSPAKVVVITHPKNKDFDSDKYKVIKIDKFHDRYLFVDDKAYHFGESFNKLGTDVSTCTYIPNFTIEHFLELTGIEI